LWGQYKYNEKAAKEEDRPKGGLKQVPFVPNSEKMPSEIHCLCRFSEKTGEIWVDMGGKTIEIR